MSSASAASSTAAPERRARLDRETVLTAAEALVDREGYDTLSMTQLAAELDTRVSTLYNHVAGLEELRSEIQLRAMLLMGRHVQRAAMGRSGADGLREMCVALRDFAGQFPQRYAALTRKPSDPDALFVAAGDTLEALSVMVRSTGLPEDSTLPTGMAIFAAVHGFVSLEVSGYFGGIEDLAQVFDQVIRGAVTSAVLEATRGR